jgi:hypothetical protein
MDPVFGAPSWIRTWLTTNKAPTPNETHSINTRQQRFKAVEQSNLKFQYPGYGKGVQGESVNSHSTSDKQVLKKTWRPFTP